MPTAVEFRGQIVTTGIFKQPVEGRVRLRKLNLDGDKQADLRVHGGVDKAVYAYPSEHYDFWRNKRPDDKLSWGAFGENFTTEGLFENKVNVGDVYRVGSGEIVATQPRMPCYKLGVRFGDMSIVRQFMNSRRSGIYFKVRKQGQVGAGDPIEIICRDKNKVTVGDIVRLAMGEGDAKTLRRAVQVEDLAAGWRLEFQDRLAKLEKK